MGPAMNARVVCANSTIQLRCRDHASAEIGRPGAERTSVSVSGVTTPGVRRAGTVRCADVEDDRAAAAYLGALAPIIAEGNAARQALARLAAAPADDADRRRLADAQAAAFRALRQRLGQLPLPFGCRRCHVVAARWLELHEAACAALAAGGPKAQQQAADLIADGRGLAAELTTEYRRLTTIAATLTDDQPEPATEHGADPAEQPQGPAPAARPARAVDAVAADAPPPSPRPSAVAAPTAGPAPPAPRPAPAVRAPTEASPAQPAATGLAALPQEHRIRLAATALHNQRSARAALEAVVAHRVRRPGGPLGQWLNAVEGVLVAAVAMSALIVGLQAVEPA